MFPESLLRSLTFALIGNLFVYFGQGAPKRSDRASGRL